MVRSMPWKFALIAVGALASFASQAGRSLADDSEGVVRICDQVPGQSAPGGSYSSEGDYSSPGGGSCPHGNSGYGGGYGGGGCRNHGVYGYHGNGQCGYQGYGCMRPCGHVHCVLDWLNPHGSCTHSPDHGYAPPGKIRTPHPQQVAYTKGFPDAWTGQAGTGAGAARATAIYMPTDTTQLGYYYQAVPRWQARRGMVPSVPNPAQWHQDLCQGQGCRQCGNHAGGSCPNCRNGATTQTSPGNGEQIISERVMDTQPQPPEPNPAPVMEAQPSPVAPTPSINSVPPSEPAPVEPAPSAAPLEKAENLNLQPLNN